MQDGRVVCHEDGLGDTMKIDYDLITIGGGLGGAALAKVMAAGGAKVLVLEREPEFRDRVRGENLVPWGGIEASRLGLGENFEAAKSNQARWLIGLGPDRDLIDTPPHTPCLAFYHPALQEALIDAAADAGAAVRRGISINVAIPGAPATVEFEDSGKTERVQARFVVGCDGRSSAVRKWGGFTPRKDPDRLTIAGVLLEGGSGYRQDTGYFFLNPELSLGAFLAPQANDRFRSYLVHWSDAYPQLHGPAALPRFVEDSIKCGVPPDFYANVKAAGPLASFKGADSWVEHPYANGIALVGDAAATTDPTWGQGLSLTLRDVRTLSEALLSDTNWEKAGHAYAVEHDRYYSALHTAEDWYAIFFYGRGEEANARRARALPLIMADPSRVPDHLVSGPDLPTDENARKRFFGEI
jgi:2-polyprenyl-6-methoxyphenol hydroxylase-like FAD-dependent oxidoreductase